MGKSPSRPRPSTSTLGSFALRRRPIIDARLTVTVPTLALIATFATLLLIVGPLFHGRETGQADAAAVRGSQAVPVPLQHSVSIGGGWWVTVDKVTANANRLFRGTPARAGTRDYLALLTLTYRGAGADDASNLINFILKAKDGRGRSYDTISNSCGQPWPKPSLAGAGSLTSGHSLHGNICFQIPADAAASLLLYTAKHGDAIVNFPQIHTVWFATKKP